MKTEDIRGHIERIEKYRRYVDHHGGDMRRCLGAVAGAVVSEETEKYVLKCGLYVIVQSGEAFKIVSPPGGSVAKEW